MLIKTTIYNHTFEPIRIQDSIVKILGKDKITESKEQKIHARSLKGETGVFLKPFQTVEQYYALVPQVDEYRGQIYVDETILTDSERFGNFAVITPIEASIYKKQILLYDRFTPIGSFNKDVINLNINNQIEFTLSLDDFGIIREIKETLKTLGFTVEIKNIKFYNNLTAHFLGNYEIKERPHAPHHPEIPFDNASKLPDPCDHFFRSDVKIPQFVIIEKIRANGGALKLYFDEVDKKQKIYVRIPYTALNDIITYLQDNYDSYQANLEQQVKQIQNPTIEDAEKILQQIIMPIVQLPIGFDVVFSLNGGGAEQILNIKAQTSILFFLEENEQIKDSIANELNLAAQADLLKFYQFDLIPKYVSYESRANQKIFIEFNIVNNIPPNSPIKKYKIKNITLNPAPPVNYRIIPDTIIENDSTTNVPTQDIQFVNNNQATRLINSFILVFEDSTVPWTYNGTLTIELDDISDPNNITAYTFTSKIEIKPDTNEFGRLKFGKKFTIDGEYLTLGELITSLYELKNFHQIGTCEILNVEHHWYAYKKVNNFAFLVDLEKDNPALYKLLSENVYVNTNLKIGEKIQPEQTKQVISTISLNPSLKQIKEANKLLRGDGFSYTTLYLSTVITYKNSQGKIYKIGGFYDKKYGEELTDIFRTKILYPEVAIQYLGKDDFEFLVFKNQIFEFPIKIVKATGLNITDVKLEIKKTIDGSKYSFKENIDYFISKENFPLSAGNEFYLIFDLNEEGIQDAELVLKTNNRFLPEVRVPVRIISIDISFKNFFTQDVKDFYVHNNMHHVALNKLVPKEVLFKIKNYSKVPIKIKSISTYSLKDRYGIPDLDTELYDDFISEEISANGYYEIQPGETLEIPAKILAKEYGFLLGFLIFDLDIFGKQWLPISAFCNNKVDRNVYILKTSPSTIKIFSAVGNAEEFYVEYKNFGSDPTTIEQNLLGFNRREYYTLNFGTLYPKRSIKYPIIFLPLGEGYRIAYLRSIIYDQVFAYKVFESDFTSVYQLQNFETITKLLGFARPEEGIPKFERGIANLGFITEEELSVSQRRQLRTITIELTNIGLTDLNLIGIESEYDDFITPINLYKDDVLKSLQRKKVLFAVDTKKTKNIFNSSGRNLLIQRYKFYFQDVKTKNIKTINVLFRLNIVKTSEYFLDYNLTEIDFGLKEVNIVSNESLIIRNFSTEPIEVEIDYVGDSAFSTLKNIRFNLFVDQDFEIPIAFIPQALTKYSGTLIINVYRNNTLLKTYEIPIKGEGTNLKVPNFKVYNEITEELKPLLKELQKEFNKAGY